MIFYRLWCAAKKQKYYIWRRKKFWREVVHRILQPYSSKKSIESLFGDLWDLFAEGKHWRIAEKAKETLEQLINRGYRLAVLSNNDSRLRSVLKDHGITDMFEKIFISSEMGVEKPDKKIFQMVETQMNEPSSSFLHLGDSHSRDVEGAKMQVGVPYFSVNR